ncbi:MAG: hypothetical protein JOZ22_06800 [Acidobacteriia bacterium]|nr:hypothetical protein [Terriglobia bacterium]
MRYLTQTIQDLYREKRDLDRIISLLEQIAATRRASIPAARPHGKKPMSPEERRQVSERIKEYWANRNGKTQSIYPRSRPKAKGAS